MHDIKIRIKPRANENEVLTYRGRLTEFQRMNEEELGRYVTKLIERGCYDRVIIDIYRG